MKGLHRVMAVTTALLVLGIAPAAVASDGSRPPEERGSRADAARETREALSAYRRALQDEIDRIGERLDALEQRARASLRDVSPETRRRLDKLREQHAAAERKLNELGDEAAHLWESVRARMNRVVDDLQRDHEAAAAEGL